MDTFAEYILQEKNLGSKMEITYYLSKKTGIFFDKSTIFKTELARMFLACIPVEMDKNKILTACLLANCKKKEIAQNLDQLKSYAKHGAEYLFTIGFDTKFCKMCEEINRYSESNPREKESDILELIDQFGGMLLDRPERIGLKFDEALVLLEHRNLKEVYNRYLQTFIDFVNKLQSYKIKDVTEISPLELLVKMYNEISEIKNFITAINYEFEPKVDDILDKMNGAERKAGKNAQILEKGNPSRPLFSEETTQKIIGKLV